MWQVIKPALRLLLLLSVLTGVIYPLFINALAQSLFPVQANGSLLIKGDKTLGSALIGQTFSQANYFWGRPSATNGGSYNAQASGGSNLGPTNPTLKAIVAQRIKTLRAIDPNNQQAVPIDLVTASASGLDPHISPAAAAFQVSRVAKARHQSIETIRQIVAQHTETRQWGLLGEPRVNVLRLNLALDANP